jgi:hypothetical protein
MVARKKRERKLTARVPAELRKALETKAKTTGIKLSELVRSALRSCVVEGSGGEAIEVQVFDLLVGAQSVLRRLADRASVVEPGTPEALVFLQEMAVLSRDLERARVKARRRVKAALRREGSKP